MSFAASSESLATLEYLVHLNDDDIADDVVLIIAELDDALIARVENESLPPLWWRSPPGLDTVAFGDRWLAERSSVALRIPSAVVRREENVLINPLHPDSQQIEIVKIEPWLPDDRLRP